MRPQRWGYLPDAPEGPYAGIPETLYVGETCIAPDTIVIDHGKIYMSEHTASVCRRLGISIQPALTYKPTDKAVLERFFRTARQSLLDKLAGYKGPDIASRGEDTEDQAFYYCLSWSRSCGSGSGRLTTTPRTTVCPSRSRRGSA